MARAQVSEAELAAVVVRWLDALGYEVFQEVELRNGGIRADIVARRGPELTIVETKTTASLALLYQTMERRRFAHRVYAGIGLGRGARAYAELCTELGIGLLEIGLGTAGSDWDVERVEELAPSRRWNSRPLKLASRLRPEHKTSAAAGSPAGGHFSRWRDTCAQLERVAAQHPGIALKAALAQVTHHYSSARVAASSLAGQIRAGALPGIRIDAGRLWPVAAPDIGGAAP